MRRAGVLERVRQRLLHDPVGREVDTGRELDRLALDRQLHRQSGLAHLLDELRGACRGPAAARVRGPLSSVRMIPSSRRISDSAWRPVSSTVIRASRSRCWSGVQQPADGARLDRHHADRVREHVVQLARDPVPLVLDGSPRLLLGPPRPLLCEARSLRMPCGRGRDHEDADEREGEPDQLGRAGRPARG